MKTLFDSTNQVTTKIMRDIVHVNIDDFHASVARLQDAALCKRPLVFGNAGSRGGVIAASYEARSEGVKAGMTVSQALRMSPRAVVVPYDVDLFERISGQLLQIGQQYTPLVEATGLDELFLDVSGCQRLYGQPVDIAMRIQKEIRQQLSLSASVGVADNKLVSEVASGRAKCGRMIDVFTGYAVPFLASLPLHRLPEMDTTLAQQLEMLSVRRVGDLVSLDRELLQRAFGFWGERLYEWCRGIDNRPVNPKRTELKRTVRHDLAQDEIRQQVLEAELFSLCEQLGAGLRKERLAAGRLQVTIIYADTVRVSGSHQCAVPTDLDGEVYEQVRLLFRRLFVRRVRIRSLIITAARLRYAAWQHDLFVRDPRIKWRKVYGAVDRARKRFGEEALQFGRSFVLQKHTAPDELRTFASS